ncbi:MAG: hypothetical protein M0P47_07550 [Bacteroidales bacterium]|nr:hypothetical protein [Bacteroidales bacterium]
MMRYQQGFLKIVIAFFFVVTVSACSSGGTKKNSESFILPESGVIHEKIRINKDSSLSYALYLPSSLKPSSPALRYPVILAFDPHSSGLLPVKLYKDLAEKYGIIMLGSNNSKNGLSEEKVLNIISRLFDEVHENYPIDSNRIYLMGFSGGSRIASLTAMLHPEVKAVIGCGAGFPQGSQPPLYKFDYFGLVGLADFNMNEMMQLDGMLNLLKMRHFITTFTGPHAWPPLENMEDAFQWITLNAMKDGKILKDEVLVSKIMQGFVQRIQKQKTENRMIEAVQSCKEAIAFADGLAEVTSFEKELQAILQLPEFKKQTLYRDNILKKEQNEQQLLMDALFSKDEAWWKARINKMSGVSMKDKNPEDTLMNSRLKAFLSLFCYSNVNAAMTQHNQEMSGKLVKIYQLADPTNPEAWYLGAVIRMQANDSLEGIRLLKTAVSTGFTDRTRTLNQPEFKSLKNSPAFFDILQKMK